MIAMTDLVPLFKCTRVLLFVRTLVDKCIQIVIVFKQPSCIYRES